MAEPILEIDGVSKRFGATVVAEDLSLRVHRGEFFTFLGPSGSGKSTILRMVAGLERPDRGRILIDGRDVAAVPPWHRHLGMVFQHYAVFPHMTVAENVAYGLKVRRQPAEEVSRRVAEMLELVGLSALRAKNVTLLSGGEQQRVALARALAPQPRMLLLDEPLSALDERIRRAMQVELKQVHRKTGTTFLYVTHDQEEALTMSDRVAVMSRGKILQVGTPRDIYDHPDERFVADFIGDTNFLTGELAAVEGAEARVRLDAGAELPARMPKGMRAGLGARVTAAIRPEHTRLVPPGEGALEGTVQNLVYFGTDSHYHLRLSDGSPFTARLQNSAGGVRHAAEGDRIGIAIAPGSVQVLRD